MAMRGVSIVVWSVMIISAYGGRCNPEYLTLPSVLCLALPYLAILSLLLILFWILSKKIIFSALGVLAIIACIQPISQAMPLNSSKEASEGSRKFKIISWNVLHTNDIRHPEAKSNRAAKYMLQSGADIICLAEMNNFSPSELKNASAALIDSLEKAYPYRAGLASNDIKVMSKYPVVRSDLYGTAGFSDRRFECFKVSMPGHELNVIMTHLYSYDLSEEERQVVTEIKSVESAKSSVKEFKGSILSKMRNAFRQRAVNAKALREAIDNIKGPLIVCGDFNDVPNSWAYSLIKGDDLRDAYVETNFGPTYTYNLHMFYFHIDQMLYRGPLKALSLKVGKINTSDHYPLIGVFEFTDRE